MSSNGALSLIENFRSFLFYSGGFLIGVSWELIWCFLKSYMMVMKRSSSFSNLITWFMMMATLGSVFLSFIFGSIASIRQNYQFQTSVWDSIGIVYGIGLFVSSGLFSLVFTVHHDSAKESFWMDSLMLISFFLMILMLHGYTATFFTMSSYFSNQVISKSALPFWSGLGQITAIEVVHVFSIIELGPPLNPAFLLISGTGIGICVTLISWGVGFKRLPHSKESEHLKDSHYYYYHCFNTSLGSLMKSFNKKDLKVYFSSRVLVGLGVTTILSSSFVFLVGLGVFNFSETETEMIFDYTISSTNINLKGRLFQHCCQVISSILMFFIDYVSIKYGMFRNRLKMKNSLSYSKLVLVQLNSDFDSDPTSVDRHPRRPYYYYTNPNFEESFYSHFCILLLSWAVVSVVGLVFGFLPIRTPMMNLIGLGMMGFGHYFIESGREYQRSVMRMARHLEGYEFDMNSVANYEFFDNVIGAGFYGVFIAIGQSLGIVGSKKLSFFIAIERVFLWMGYSMGFVLVPLIVSCRLLLLCNNRRSRRSLTGEHVHESRGVFKLKQILEHPHK